MSGAEPSDSGERPRLSIGPDEWPSTVADKIVEVVDTVKTKTTDRVVLAVRVVVYSLVIAVTLISLMVLLVIASVRMADAYLPIGDGVGSATWAAHGFVGAFLMVLGLGAWRSRSGSARPFVIALILDLLFVIGIIFYGVIRALT